MDVMEQRFTEVVIDIGCSWRGRFRGGTENEEDVIHIDFWWKGGEWGKWEGE